MRLLMHRFVLLLAGLGATISFVLGLFSGVSLLILLFRVMVSGVCMGAGGYLFLFVLSRVVPTAEFEELLALLEGKSISESSPPSWTGEESVGAGEEGENIPSGNMVNMVEDSDTWESGMFSPSSEEKKNEEEVFNPAVAVRTGEDSDQEFTSGGDLSSLKEDYEQLRSEYEKEKPTFKDNEISFKVHDKKINTSPELVAKAIRTILSKDS